jgi:hypothetical protein
MMNTEKPLSIVIKSNNCAIKEVCALCGFVDRANTPFDAFIEGTWDWVCSRCLDARKRPGYSQALDILNCIMITLFRGGSIDAIHNRAAKAMADSRDLNF